MALFLAEKQMSPLGRVSRASPVHTAARNYTEMEEGPSGSAIRSLIPSHRERLWSKAMVVSIAETSGR